MGITIIEVLQNANINLDNVAKIGLALLPLAKEQLNNAVVLLEKGYSINDDFDEIINKYNNVDNAPEI